MGVGPKIVVPHNDHRLHIRLHYSPNHDKLYTYPLQKVDILSYFGTQIRDDLMQIVEGSIGSCAVENPTKSDLYVYIFIYVCSV